MQNITFPLALVLVGGVTVHERPAMRASDVGGIWAAEAVEEVGALPDQQSACGAAVCVARQGGDLLGEGG